MLFVRNTQFYKRIRIGKVIVANGVAQVLAMVPRKDITSIRTANGLVLIADGDEKARP